MLSGVKRSSVPSSPAPARHSSPPSKSWREQGADPDGDVRTCVRVRPMSEREEGAGARECVAVTRKGVVLRPVDNEGHIYDECIAPLVAGLFDGFNATILAYGQTGSGKTHTMAGGPTRDGVCDEGLLQRVVRAVCTIASERKESGECAEVVLTASAAQIYNEELHDLACPSTPSRSLTFLEGGIGGVSGLRRHVVSTQHDLLSFFARSSLSRMTATTRLNDSSSRSHAIFTIEVLVTHTHTSFAKLQLVDLAGSERVKRSGVTGDALREASHINAGLLALGNVINALAECSEYGERKRAAHIPYRSSKLTRALQDSLGGNARTVLIACVSPSELDFDETHNTLKYASHASRVRNAVYSNRTDRPSPEGEVMRVPEEAGPSYCELLSRSTTRANTQRCDERERGVKSPRARREQYDTARRARGGGTTLCSSPCSSPSSVRSPLSPPPAQQVVSPHASCTRKTQHGHKPEQPTSKQSLVPIDCRTVCVSSPALCVTVCESPCTSGREDNINNNNNNTRAQSCTRNGEGFATETLSQSPLTSPKETASPLVLWLPDGVQLTLNAVGRDDPAVAALLGTAGDGFGDKGVYIVARATSHGDALVGCLMATEGTQYVRTCVWELDEDPWGEDPNQQHAYEGVVELWGLQIPRSTPQAPPIDRLLVSQALLLSLCLRATKDACGATHALCVPRPELLSRWLAAGVPMREVPLSQRRLIYPESAADHRYYRGSTVAWFGIQETRVALAAALARAGGASSEHC
eukprot:jgi/Chlat1/6967/Chrsp52S06648